MAYTGFHGVLLSFNWFELILLYPIKFYWVLLGFTGFYWGLLGLISCYWEFLGFVSEWSWVFGVLLGFPGCFSGFYCVLPVIRIPGTVKGSIFVFFSILSCFLDRVPLVLWRLRWGGEGGGGGVGLDGGDVDVDGGSSLITRVSESTSEMHPTLHHRPEMSRRKWK